jgi:hypothetical protein
MVGSNERGEMNTQKILGLSGSAVLALGAFMPIVSLPIIGSINYFNNGQGDGIFIVLLAAVAAVLTFFGQYKFLWIPGGASLVLLVITLTRFIQLVNDAQSEITDSLAGNPFAGLAEGLMASVQLQWGWMLLFLGSIAIVSASFVRKADSDRKKDS